MSRGLPAGVCGAVVWVAYAVVVAVMMSVVPTWFVCVVASVVVVVYV